MRIEANTTAAFQPTAAGSATRTPDIRVTFEPVTAKDTTLAGMTQYMLRTMGVGTNVNLLA